MFGRDTKDGDTIPHEQCSMLWNPECTSITVEVWDFDPGNSSKDDKLGVLEFDLQTEDGTLHGSPDRYAHSLL